MNGVIWQLQEAHRQLIEESAAKFPLNQDLVMADEKLFQLNAEELSHLSQQMFEQTQFCAAAIRMQGGYYEIRFHRQRTAITELIKFLQSHPDYSPLQGPQLCSSICANGGVIDLNSLNKAYTAICAFDNAVVIEPPRITRQPQDQSVLPGEPVKFTVTASGTGISYQWNRNGEALVGANRDHFVTCANELTDQAVFTVTVSNLAGSVTSHEARLRMARP